MFKRFCPTCQGICTDGYANECEYLCVFWDSVEGECAFSKSTILACEAARVKAELLRQYPKPES